MGRAGCFVAPTKVPFAGSHAYLDATTNPAELDALAARFRGAKLVAVATGAASGIDILDIDPRNGGDRWLFEHADQLVRTRIHETRSVGWHFLFKHSVGLRNSNKLAPSVEFLSTGRWAVWWPAHAGRVLCEGPVAELPGWHRGEIRPSTLNLKPVQSTNSTFLRSKYLLLKLERTPPGNRHNMLLWVACRFGNMIGEGKMKIEVAEQLLVGAAKANGLWRERPDNCLQTIRDGLRRGIEEMGKRADFLFPEGPRSTVEVKHANRDRLR
jgi:hypothetical protein